MKEGINNNRSKDESLVHTMGTGFASTSHAYLTAILAQGKKKARKEEENLKGSKKNPQKTVHRHIVNKEYFYKAV